MKQRGFTIIELLLAVSLAGMASVLMISAFVYSYGGVLAREVEADMLQQSQLLIRNISDDLREGSVIRSTNTVADAYNTGGWVTSDPANILIVTVPALDSFNNLIYDPETGYPYYHEAIYFKDDSDGKMYRRLLRNDLAVSSTGASTCPAASTGCIQDTELVDSVDNMLFEFFDINDDVTTVPEEARSVEVTINVQRSVLGRNLQTTNTTRVTLRNEF